MSRCGGEGTLSRMGYAALGKRVRARRKVVGLTQEQLAGSAGLTAATLGRLELGKLDEPKLPTLDAIAHALGVKTPWLLSEGDAVGDTPEVYEQFLRTSRGKSMSDEERGIMLSVAQRPEGSAPVTLDQLNAMLIAMRGALDGEELKGAIGAAEKARKLNK